MYCRLDRTFRFCDALLSVLSYVMIVSLAFPASAQTVVVDTLRAARPWGTPVEYTFPSIRVVENEAATEHINNSLYVDFLGVGANAEDPLSALWGEDTGNGMSRVNSLAWSCVRSSAGIITIAFTGESCTAYCEGFEMHFLYDVGTGMRLDPRRLFTPEGERAMLTLIDQRWRVEVDTYLHALDEVQDAGNAQEIMRTCLAERPVGKPILSDLLLEPDGLQFIIPACSRYVDRIEDEPRWAVYMFHYELLDHLLPEVKDALDW